MPRARTATDPFTAIAEPHRRRILALLARGERPVGDVVRRLRLSQPQVSKHLRVLREVGLVAVRGEGQQRVYRVEAAGLKRVHDWVATFERLWLERFDRLDAYLSTPEGADDVRS